jgi:hypothetical protein
MRGAGWNGLLAIIVVAFLGQVEPHAADRAEEGLLLLFLGDGPGAVFAESGPACDPPGGGRLNWS